MIDMKTIRESVGYSHQKQRKNADAWYSLAVSFHAATEILDEFRDRIPSDSRPFAFNAAISLELIFKAILAKQNLQIPDGKNGHNLCSLCAMAQVTISEKQMDTLELLTEEIVWAARYPVPKNKKHWNDYHDRIFEKHVVRSHSENVYSKMANKDTFPNWENYTRIWKVCVTEFLSTS
jgi:hypothetical protein